MSLITCPSEQKKNQKFMQKKLLEKNGKKRLLFFNPETETDPDRKPTFEQKTDPDPDRSQKLNPPGI
jgi:hypothetical protein